MNDFLPISREDMEKRGWDQVDFTYVIGDAYVDHPSFGPAIISRILEAAGYRVGIIAQPDWKDDKSIDVFGEPRLGFLISAGNMDSMVNHYSVSKKRRAKDFFTPGGVMGRRPDHATVVYGNLIRRTYKSKPIIIGGIEASLMYTRRNNRLTDHEHVFKRHYFEIPLYARYRLELPSVSRVFAPYIFTGPSFAILFDNSSSDLYSNRKTYISWDAGLGMDLFQHVRISASYGLGITKALKYVNKEYEGSTVNGKDKFWTVSAAYLF